MVCPHLEYREADEGLAFAGERAFCTVAESFVQPMRADVCNDRHGFDHVAHCEFYREAASLDPLEGLHPGPPSDGAGDDAGDGAAETDATGDEGGAGP